MIANVKSIKCNNYHIPFALRQVNSFALFFNIGILVWTEAINDNLAGAKPGRE